MDDKIYKEVNFYLYCETCKHKELEETDEPCCDCLADTVNLYSHKPTKWEEGENKK